MANVPVLHGLLSAAYHDHDGPIYVKVIHSADGVTKVECTGTDGRVTIKEVDTNKVEMGRHVEQDYNNGQVEEKRYRFFLIFIDDLWHCCQVDKVTKVGNGYNVTYRLRGAATSSTTPLATFSRKTIKIAKLDFVVGVGDEADISITEMRAAMATTNAREDARRQCADDERVRLRSPMGLQTSVVMGQAWNLEPTTTPPLLDDMEAALRVSVEDSLEPSSSVIGTEGPVLSLATMVTDQDMDDMMGTDSAAGKSNFEDDNRRQYGSGGSRWSRKNEYQPPSGYLLRNTFIFDPRAEFTLRGTTPGERLDCIMSAELSKTPGFNIGHADLVFGFAFALQPLGTSFLGDVGSGSVRSVVEANKNKAVITALLRNDVKLTNMGMIVNVTLFFTRTFGRWYRRELVDMAIFMDQFMRGAILIEGEYPAQCIVDGYVILLEAALAGLGRDLGDMTEHTYNVLIGAACTRFKKVVDMSSQQFAYSVICARRIAASVHQAPMRGVRSPERGPPKRQDRGGRQRGGQAENSNNNGGNGNPGRIPAYVISALKDASGQTICGNFAIRNACRMQNCRYRHAPVPSNLPNDVALWIKNNAPVRSKQ